MIIKKIHQLAKTSQLKDFEIESQELLKSFNPDYEYKLWTDDDLEKISKENHPRLFNNWEKLKGIHKADLGRYLVLYLEGGFYCDTDFYVNDSFSKLKINDNIYLAPSTRDFIFMKDGVTNYFIYSPPGKKFFLDLIEESLNRIQKYKNTDPSYISSTSGKIMIDSVIKKNKHEISSFSNSEIVNKYCSHTDTGQSFAYHDGGTSRDKKDDSWVNGTVLSIMNLECKMRETFKVRGNICQIPIIFISFAIIGLFLILYFSIFKYKRKIISNI
jgi:mannosyltransferase OCH1-like enzyme